MPVGDPRRDDKVTLLPEVKVRRAASALRRFHVQEAR